MPWSESQLRDRRCDKCGRPLSPANQYGVCGPCRVRAMEQMLLGGRFERIIEGVFEEGGEILGLLFRVAGTIALLWALIWLVKTLWYLS